MNALCAGLAALGTPRVFTAQLLFLWRYTFVLGGEGARMATAREARGGRGSPTLAVYGSLAGHLLLRAFERAERIHRAMLARGFDGEMRSLRALRWTARDTLFVAGWIAFFIVARAVHLPLLLGRLITGSAHEPPSGRGHRPFLRVPRRHDGPRRRELRVTHGESVAIVGGNGAGKSTLLLMMAGLLEPNAGEVRIGDVSVTPGSRDFVRRTIGFVFQDSDDQIFMRR